MIPTVCAAGLPESGDYEIRWSRCGGSKEVLQLKEQDTLTYSQVDSTSDSGSVTEVLPLMMRFPIL